jgi:hypothetical protein
MSYFKHHVFICTNQREGEQCCNNVGGSDMFAYAKDRIGALKQNGPAPCASTRPAASAAATRGR